MEAGIEALDIPANIHVTLWDKQSLSHVLWVKKRREKKEARREGLGGGCSSGGDPQEDAPVCPDS